MKHPKRCTVAILFLTLIIPTINYAQSGSGWISLFNGKDLKNWIQKGGKAEFRIEDEQIVGISKAGTPNSFLTTQNNYSDFILEFEVFVDPDLNSGVQIRSHSDSQYRNGVVHGYQVEIDPSTRAFSGGIYDEQDRGWLYPMARNPKGGRAFKNGVWNTYHIEAIGNVIKTWINGVQCAYLADDQSKEGFIALQVHAAEDDHAGKIVRWRNIRIKTTDLNDESWRSDPDVPQVSYLKNQLTEWERRHGFRLLWDGKTSNGWKGAKIDHFPDKGWEMKDGILTIHESGGAESAGPGDIITENLFSDFELELEFKITKGANSGIKYFVDPELNKGPGSAIGLEFQLLDDENHPDAKLGVNGNRTVGSLYDLIPAGNLSVPGRGKQFKGVGEWNHARIVVHGGHVEHWLNNEKVVEYDRFSQMFSALVSCSKYKVWADFGQWPEGHILLQDHGNEVQFRSIKVREF